MPECLHQHQSSLSSITPAVFNGRTSALDVVSLAQSASRDCGRETLRVSLSNRKVATAPTAKAVANSSYVNVIDRSTDLEEKKKKEIEKRKQKSH